MVNTGRTSQSSDVKALSPSAQKEQVSVVDVKAAAAERKREEKEKRRVDKDERRAAERSKLEDRRKKAAEHPSITKLPLHASNSDMTTEATSHKSFAPGDSADAAAVTAKLECPSGSPSNTVDEVKENCTSEAPLNAKQRRLLKRELLRNLAEEAPPTTHDAQDDEDALALAADTSDALPAVALPLAKESAQRFSSLGWSVSLVTDGFAEEDEKETVETARRGKSWGEASRVAEAARETLRKRKEDSGHKTPTGLRSAAASGGGCAPFSTDLFRSESSRLDARLLVDYKAILDGHCKYVPGLLCGDKDFKIIEKLAVDLEVSARASNGGMIEWSKHLKHENPTFSPAFKMVVDHMARHFDVEVFASRLNFYRDGTDWKPFHHDSHAYGHTGVKEDFTMGASFGESRSLAFLHEPSGSTFALPQNNGDCFAFTSEANRKFKHGVPRIRSNSSTGCRFSIIAWGRRRSINAKNGGSEEEHGPRPIEAIGYAPQPVTASTSKASPSSSSRQTDSADRRNATVDVLPISLVASLVKKKRMECTHALRRSSGTPPFGRVDSVDGAEAAQRKQRRSKHHVKNIGLSK